MTSEQEDIDEFNALFSGGVFDKPLASPRSNNSSPAYGRRNKPTVPRRADAYGGEGYESDASATSEGTINEDTEGCSSSSPIKRFFNEDDAVGGQLSAIPKMNQLSSSATQIVQQLIYQDELINEALKLINRVTATYRKIRGYREYLEEYYTAVDPEQGIKIKKFLSELQQEFMASERCLKSNEALRTVLLADLEEFKKLAVRSRKSTEDLKKIVSQQPVKTDYNEVVEQRQSVQKYREAAEMFQEIMDAGDGMKRTYLETLGENNAIIDGLKESISGNQRLYFDKISDVAKKLFMAKVTEFQELSALESQLEEAVEAGQLAGKIIIPKNGAPFDEELDTSVILNLNASTGSESSH
ncbi:unnamed protein product, partial [Mesorhabditis spiculigera]